MDQIRRQWGCRVRSEDSEATQLHWHLHKISCVTLEMRSPVLGLSVERSCQIAESQSVGSAQDLLG